MPNDELKERIKEILRKRMTELLGSCHTDEIPLTEEGAEAILFHADEFADALISAGIGDVKTAQEIGASATAMAVLEAAKAEHRAQVAEIALDKAVELAYEFRTEADTLSCSSCPMFHIFDSCKERGLYQDCSKQWKEELIKQAEKELAEEEKE